MGIDGIVTNPIDLRLIDDDYRTVSNISTANYRSLIDMGVAPEQARFILPQGTYTEWWWTGSLAAYARVHSLRSDEHAQWEVRQYADAIDKIVSPLSPVSWKHLTDCSRESGSPS